MATQLELLHHAYDLFDKKAIYVWGMNANTIISKSTIDSTYKSCKTSTYDKTYYDNKLNEGKGHIGSDCSGSLYPISKYDTTAQGYYNRCMKKGRLKDLPKDKVCLVFTSDSSNSDKKIVHVGTYLGNGLVFHMASSKRNAVIEDVNVRGWQFYGLPDFITDYSTWSVPEADSPVVYMTTTDVNLRNGGTTKASVITVVPKNTLVTIIDGVKNTDWEQVCCIINNKQYIGFLSSKYLTESQIKLTRAKIACTSLYVRTGKGTSYSAITQLPSDTEIFVKDIGKWSLIVYNNRLGYCSCTSKYVKTV